ncbi:hypothetical protein R1521_05795 [Rhizobium brockwellii]|uniref:Uncharacterized protein n=1 Tax=Rhizobium brockwellii TaxID=3019932 RepID=A0ABU3YH36_9HYPH|nr:hypothetical protein [Rhizobium brockwellii]MDV4178018.1 hypothetical protein [Rhizobium brockwellii]MDV4185017.1 hypothetical protein [Rhizobium brockwellii]
MEDKLTYSAIAAIIIWLLSKIYDLINGRFAEKNEREKFLIALFAEIDFNMQDLKEAQGDYNHDQLKALIGKQPHKSTPYMMFTYHDQIFSDNLKLIHHVGQSYVGDVVAFYGFLRNVAAQVDTMFERGYANQKLDNKVRILSEILQDVERALEVGGSILNTMEEKYGDLKLRRRADSLANVETEIARKAGTPPGGNRRFGADPEAFS